MLYFISTGFKPGANEATKPSHPENTAGGSVVQDLCDNMILSNIKELYYYLFQTNLSRIPKVLCSTPSGLCFLWLTAYIVVESRRDSYKRPVSSKLWIFTFDHPADQLNRHQPEGLIEPCKGSTTI